jgi:UDP-glucose 4-epimerase
MTENILVVGGAGYIGSHMVNCLLKDGLTPIVLDNLSSGHAEAVTGAELIIGDIADSELLDSIFTTHKISAVMHFASYIQVGESVVNPAIYYDNNVARTINLLNAMVRHKVLHFIFSSTAAIFGNPAHLPINEAHPTNPINPYGRSKLMVEQLLSDYHAAYGLQYGCLRYFNAAGAEPNGEIGERHDPETHLIPLVLQVASGRRANIKIFGNDYDTQDGTCLRDYIHVCDLADAHLLCLRKLQAGLPYGHFNLGTGKGYSVQEVVDISSRVTGKPIQVQMEARRAGDPATLIADGASARSTLGWQPTMSDLETIITDAWRWEQKLLNLNNVAA